MRPAGSNWVMALSTIALVLVLLVGAEVLAHPGLLRIRVAYVALGALVWLVVAMLSQLHRFLRDD
jgi:hypothetical protein